MADAARTVPGAAGGDAAKSGSERRRKGELLSAATSLAEGQRGRERRRRQRGVSEAGNTLCRESSSVPCLAKRRAGKKKKIMQGLKPLLEFMIGCYLPVSLQQLLLG